MATLEERFWSKVEKTDYCWNWTGASDRKGYGQIRLSKKGGPRYAHRVSFGLEYGDFPNKLFVLHRCDNVRCVRPDHLFLGTFQDNMDDMFAKGRDSPPPVMYGETNPASKLSEEDVRIIRTLFDPKKRNQTALARRFGVDRKTIFNIGHGRIWKHVK